MLADKHQTADSRLYPLRFEPVLKDYVWGGRNLEEVLGRSLPAGIIAESWEIAAHEDGTSTVRNGPYAGLPLTAVHELLGLELIGRKNAWAQDRGKFPLLIKLLDARDKLSVQVHPDDAYALAHEGNELGKTEMWVVLHAEPGAAIILGLREGVTPQTFRDAIGNGTLEAQLQFLPIKTGDFVCVPSGTVHAILGGSLIAEVQQNSNTTYRVYDWNRVQGPRPRPLHIEQALQVISFGRGQPERGVPQPVADRDGVCRSLLCRNRYFTTERIKFAQGTRFTGRCDGDSLEIWGVLEGEVLLSGLPIQAVEFVLLPAAMGPFEIHAQGEATCLRVYVDSA